jgi:hypothetical protein
MAWVPIAAAVAGSVANKMMEGDGGKGAASSTPSSMAQNMPSWLQDRFTASLQGMPSNVNVGFGGSVYPGTYGPMMRTAKALYSPAGQNATGGTTSSLSGGLAAAAPWMWMAANNQGMTGTGLTSGGNYAIPGSTGSWSNYPMPAYSGYSSDGNYYDPYAYNYRE